MSDFFYAPLLGHIRLSRIESVRMRNDYPGALSPVLDIKIGNDWRYIAASDVSIGPSGVEAVRDLYRDILKALGV